MSDKSNPITNDEDVIDSRDVIARIEYLRDLQDDTDDPLSPEEEAETLAELTTLEALANEGEQATPDWTHGATLIRDSYFNTYASILAEDIGAFDKAAGWPLNCIDWDKAAEELQVDYTPIDFDGVTYWVGS